jgi:NCS1 family nucleobase:cation symporter-1
MLGALSPSFKHMTSTIPASSHITTQDLVGIIIWYICYIPLVMVPPERLQRPFIFSSAAFGCTLIGLLAWSVPKAHGGGPLFHTQNTASSTPFSMMLGITSILGSWGSGTIGQSDWVRYSQRRYYPLLSQLVAAPVMITCCALVGVVVTSASDRILGQLIWSPIELLSAIQDYYDSSSAVRAAVFFAGFGCTCAQLSINVLLNSVSTGMDMAGLWPKYINIRRGAYILATVSPGWRQIVSMLTCASVRACQ